VLLAAAAAAAAALLPVPHMEIAAAILASVLKKVPGVGYQAAVGITLSPKRVGSALSSTLDWISDGRYAWQVYKLAPRCSFIRIGRDMGCRAARAPPLSAPVSEL